MEQISIFYKTPAQKASKDFAFLRLSAKTAFKPASKLLTRSIKTVSLSLGYQSCKNG